MSVFSLVSSNPLMFDTVICCCLFCKSSFYPGSSPPSSEQPPLSLPGGPVVKTVLAMHNRWAWSLAGELKTPHVMWHGQMKKSTKKKVSQIKKKNISQGGVEGQNSPSELSERLFPWLKSLASLLTPGGSEVKVSACSVGDPGSIPGLGRSPGEGNGSPLQYSCLENPMEGGAW